MKVQVDYNMNSDMAIEIMAKFLSPGELFQVLMPYAP